MNHDFHHDGSALYVPAQAPQLGEDVTVFLRGTRRSGVSRVYVRSTADGKPKLTEAVADRVSDGVVWWRAAVPVRNPVTRYRFLLIRATGCCWLNALGLFDHDVPDDTDFRLVAYPAPPSWAADAIVYQIFPDRFARSAAAAARAVPSWAIPCDWETPVIGRGPETHLQLYGGDLDGVVAHLDHIASLGVNTVYLTPIFPARSNHRYDAASFSEVDPLLGGGAALARLASACRDRGMRLIGDLTTNHTGDTHPWFTGPDSAELYYRHADGSYEAWQGVPTLPKLNWGSQLLRRRFCTDPDAVVTRWLEHLDGWRADVANMTGRCRADDYAHEVAGSIAAALRRVRPDGLLVGEHTNDASQDLDVGGWHGTMNYAGFARPVLSWLQAPSSSLPGLFGVPGGLPRCSGRATVDTIRAFSARMSWRSVLHSWTLLGSHDTPRVRTVVGDPGLIEVALGLMATFPGAPMVFMGDELGVAGVSGEDSRRPMPWSRPGSWDQATLARYRALLNLRAAQHSLRHGGLRFAHVGDDVIAYWRETAHSRLLVMVRRAPGAPIQIPEVRAAENLYGAATLHPVDGVAWLPGDGPTVQIWACPLTDGERSPGTTSREVAAD